MKNRFPQLKGTTLAMAVAALFVQPVIQAQETTDKKLQAVEVVGTSPLPGLGIEKTSCRMTCRQLTKKRSIAARA